MRVFEYLVFLHEGLKEILGGKVDSVVENVLLLLEKVLERVEVFLHVFLDVQQGLFNIDERVRTGEVAHLHVVDHAGGTEGFHVGLAEHVYLNVVVELAGRC